MSVHGTYNRDTNTRFQSCGGSTILAAADNLSVTPRVLAAAKAKYTIFVKAITVHVVTDNAATLTFRGTTGTAPVVAGTKASPGIGPIVFEFPGEGRALDEGEAFELANSAAGLAADITWDAYYRPTGTMVPSQI